MFNLMKGNPLFALDGAQYIPPPLLLLLPSYNYKGNLELSTKAKEIYIQENIYSKVLKSINIIKKY